MINPAAYFLTAFVHSFRDLLTKGIFLLFLLPMAFGLGLWVFVAVGLWNWIEFSTQTNWTDFLNWTARFFAIGLSLPVILFLIYLIVSFFFIPVAVRLASKSYPTVLITQAGGWGMFKRILPSLLIFFAVMTVSWPLFFIPVLGIIWGLLLASFLNYRVLITEISGEFLSLSEVEEFRREQGGLLKFVSLVIAIMSLIPGFFLLAPIWGGLLVSHLGLKWKQQRSVQ